MAHLVFLDLEEKTARSRLHENEPFKGIADLPRYSFIVNASKVSYFKLF